MLGLMQQRPLLVSSLVDYASTWHGGREIVSRDPEGAFHRSTFAEIAARAKRVANALDALGVGRGDRIATLAWNGHRHLELYYGVTSSGRVLHTVNPRLFPEQLQYIMHHAEDAYVFFDPVFAPLVEQLAPKLPLVRGFVALCERSAMPSVKGVSLLCYEDLLAKASPDYAWPLFDENTASTLCYTSGTTGNPKGVMYSHRSTVLHAFAACAADALALTARDSILVVVPLFHANAWSLPFSAAMSGSKLVLPGPKLDPESLYMLLEQEGCTKAFGIPTIWLNFLAWVEANRERLDLSTAEAQAGRLRRRGAAARDDREVPRSHGRLPAPCVGHDGNKPARDHRIAVGQARRREPERPRRHAGQAGPPGLRHRTQARRPRRARRAARRRLGRRTEGARQLGHLGLFQRRGRSGRRRGRMARHGRRRHDRP